MARVRYQGTAEQRPQQPQPQQDTIPGPTVVERAYPQGVAYQPGQPTWQGYPVRVAYQGNAAPTWRGYQQGVYYPPAAAADYSRAGIQAATGGANFDPRRWAGMPYWLRRLMLGTAGVGQVPAQFQVPYIGQPPAMPGVGDA